MRKVRSAGPPVIAEVFSLGLFRREKKDPPVKSSRRKSVNTLRQACCVCKPRLCAWPQTDYCEYIAVLLASCPQGACNCNVWTHFSTERGNARLKLQMSHKIIGRYRLYLSLTTHRVSRESFWECRVCIGVWDRVTTFCLFFYFFNFFEFCFQYD